MCGGRKTRRGTPRCRCDGWGDRVFARNWGGLMVILGLTGMLRMRDRFDLVGMLDGRRMGRCYSLFSAPKNSQLY